MQIRLDRNMLKERLFEAKNELDRQSDINEDDYVWAIIFATDRDDPETYYIKIADIFDINYEVPFGEEGFYSYFDTVIEELNEELHFLINENLLGRYRFSFAQNGEFGLMVYPKQ